MVPGQRFDKPGKSPFMDMPLQPVYADEASDSGVKVSPQVQQNLGIRTATVKRADCQRVVRRAGHGAVRRASECRRPDPHRGLPGASFGSGAHGARRQGAGRWAPSSPRNGWAR